jgi:hypothetical protein
MEERDLQRCKPSFLSARYNACNHFPAFVRPDVVKPPAYSGVMTMQRFLFALLVSMLALVCATQACAGRNFPEQAKRGDMTAYEYPAMKIDDNIYRLAPGSRIFNHQNRIIMPASLQVQTAPVMYMLDMSGALSRVWLLTGEEAARLPVSK